MSFLKKFKDAYQNLTNNIPKAEETQPKTEGTQPQTNQNHTENSQKLTLDSGNNISDFPLRFNLIIGKMGYGKTTISKGIQNHYADNGIPVVNVQILADMENAKECVLVFDDLKRDLAKSAFEKIVENIREIRHKKLIIIFSHHMLDDVPKEILQLCEKVIMFNNSIQLNSPMAKVNYVITKARKEALHDFVLTLEHYRYVIVKEGKIFGDYANTDISPIVGDTGGAEIKLMGKSANGAPIQILDTNAIIQQTASQETDLKKLVREKCPEYDYLTVTEKIIQIQTQFPKLKPAIIARIVGTTADNTWKTLSNARKGGKLPKKEIAKPIPNFAV
ncbi:Uncharacterised protein [uncultured archaeon]|nr:Uncharacterised protein [uncultured archaeon]